MARTEKNALNEANPNRLPSAAQFLPLGNALALLPRTVSGAVTANILALPEEARALVGLWAYATAGTAAGEKAYVIGGAPAAGEFSITPEGNLIFNGTDAITAAQVAYIAIEGEVYEETAQVVGSSAALSSGRVSALLLEAEVVTGLVPGAKAVQPRGTAAAAGEAELNDLGTAVTFDATDVVAGTARLRYVIFPGTGGTPNTGANMLADVQF